MMKNAHHIFPVPKVTYLDYLFYPTNSPKLKGIQFTVIRNREKQQIIPLKKLEPEKVCDFCLINDLKTIHS